MKSYRIGEFAHKLGVSPDFLKYQERFGVVDPQQTSSNYRFYSFPQASRVYASLMYQNLGLPLREIGELMNEDGLGTIAGRLNQSASNLHEQARRCEILAEAAEELERDLDRATSSSWYVTEVPPFAFLAHSMGSSFVDDERIRQIREMWVAWMPVVSSCQRIVVGSGPDASSWGFLVPLEKARRIGLPLDEPCETIPGGRYLVAASSLDLHYGDGKAHIDRQEVIDVPLRLLDTLGLASNGPLYQRVLPYSHEQGHRYLNSVFYAPLTPPTA